MGANRVVECASGIGNETAKSARTLLSWRACLEAVVKVEEIGDGIPLGYDVIQFQVRTDPCGMLAESSKQRTLARVSTARLKPIRPDLCENSVDHRG
jgi:hypothetical protein